MVAIHFNWLQDAAGVAAVLPEVEAALAPFGAQPHWGKLFGYPQRTSGPSTPASPTSSPS